MRQLLVMVAAMAFGLTATAAKTYNNGDTISGVNDSSETSVTINDTVYVSGDNTYSKATLTMNNGAKLVLASGQTAAKLTAAKLVPPSGTAAEIGVGVTLVASTGNDSTAAAGSNTIAARWQGKKLCVNGVYDANHSPIAVYQDNAFTLTGSGTVFTDGIWIRNGGHMSIDGPKVAMTSNIKSQSGHYGFMYRQCAANYIFGTMTLGLADTDSQWERRLEGTSYTYFNGTLTLDTLDMRDKTTARTLTWTANCAQPTGNGGIKKINVGTADFQFSPAWTGGTEVQGGTLKFSATSVTHQGNVTVSGGRLEHPNASPTVKGNLTLAGGTLVATLGKTMTVSGSTSVTKKSTIYVPVTTGTAKGAYTIVSNFGAATTDLVLDYDTTCGLEATLEKSGNDLVVSIGTVLRWKGGSGWNWTDNNWLNGAGQTVGWTEGCIADFTAAAGGEVAVPSDVTPAGIKLGDGYSFTGAGKVRIDALYVPAGMTAAFANIYSTGSAFAKNGAGTLALGGDAPAATVNANAGTLALAGSCSWTAATLNVADGATVGADGAAKLALKSFMPASGATIGKGLTLSSDDTYGDTAFSGRTFNVDGTWIIKPNGTQDKNKYLQFKGVSMRGSGTLVSESFGMSGGQTCWFEGMTLHATSIWVFGRMYGNYAVTDVTLRMQSPSMMNYSNAGGRIKVADGKTLTIDTRNATNETLTCDYKMNNDGNYDRIDVSAGCLRKIGGGTLTFDYDLPLTGASTVEGGTLAMNANCTAPLTVACTETGYADDATLKVLGTRTFSAEDGVTLGSRSCLDLCNGATNAAMFAAKLAVADNTAFKIDVVGATCDLLKFTGAQGLQIAAGKTITVEYALDNPSTGIAYVLTSGAKLTDLAATINDYVKTKEGCPLETTYSVTTAGELAVTFASAGDAVWTGQGADDNWMTAANWKSGYRPDSGSPLVFSGTTRLAPYNNFTDATFPSITFGGDAGAFTLSGNALTLEDGSIVNGSSANQTVALDIAAPDAFAISSPNGGTLTLKDASFTAGGALTLSASNGGTLALDGATLTSAGNIEFPNVAQTLSVAGASSIVSTSTVAKQDRFRTGDFTVSGGKLTIDASIYPLGKGKNIRLADGAEVTVARPIVWDSGVCYGNQSAITVDSGATLNLAGIDAEKESGSFIGSYGFKLHADGTVNVTGHLSINQKPLVDGSGTVNACGGLFTDKTVYWPEQEIDIGVARLNLGAIGIPGNRQEVVNLVSASTTFAPYDADTKIGATLKAADANGTDPVFDTVDKDGTARTVTFSGQMAGAVRATKKGAGTLLFANGANCASNGAEIAVAEGTLSFQDGAAGANVFNALRVANGTTLAFDVTAMGADALETRTAAAFDANPSVTVAVKMNDGWKPGAYKLVSQVALATTDGLTLAIDGTAEARLAIVDSALCLYIEEELPADAVLWTGLGGNDNWSTVENWKNGVKPSETTVTVYFDGTTRLAPVNDIAGLNLTKIVFRTGAGAFTLGGAETLAVAAVENASLCDQTLALPLSAAALGISSSTKGVVVAGAQPGLSGALVPALGTLAIRDLVAANVTSLPAAFAVAGDSVLAGITFNPNTQALSLADGAAAASVAFANMSEYKTGTDFVVPEGVTLRNLKTSTTGEKFVISADRTLFVDGVLDQPGLGLGAQRWSTGGDVAAVQPSKDGIVGTVNAAFLNVRGGGTFNLSKVRVNITGPQWYVKPWGQMNFGDGFTLGVKGTDTEAVQAEESGSIYVNDTVTVDTLDAGDGVTPRRIVFHQRVDGGERDTLRKVGAGTLVFSPVGELEQASGEYLARGTVRTEGGTLRFENTCRSTNLVVTAGGRLEMLKVGATNNVTVAAGGVFAAVENAAVEFADATLALADGAVLAYEAKRLGDTTKFSPVTFGAGGALALPQSGKVKLRFESLDAFYVGKPHTLVKGADLAEGDLAKFALETPADGVQLLVEDGNLVLKRKSGMMILVR